MARASEERLKLRIIYDGACPFCDDYVRHQRLGRAVDGLELVDARAHPEVLAEHSIDPASLEDGMVVIADGRPHHGAQAIHLLATLGDAPSRAWVRAVAAASRSERAARILYPILKAGRRAALALLGIPRFPRR
ncbi:MAG: DCC1-like thiol-disulfide oxidoreductase family protein [Bacillota bacterium]